MYYYADRILMQILAFSLGPLIGLLITALSNWILGMIIGSTSFIFIFLQPYFSDECLKNTAEGLELAPVICAEGQVAYQGADFNDCGKLFFTRNGLIFVINNSIDFTLPLSSIISVDVEKIQQFSAIQEMEPILELKSPNLPQLVSMVGRAADHSTGYLKIKVKKHIFFDTFYFQVSYPYLWQRNIQKFIGNCLND